MGFGFRLLEDKDYETLCIWWKWWRFQAPPKDYLPEDGCGGIMITKDGIDICAGFLFLNNSKICWLEYIISNPEYRENDRKEALGFLINNLCYIAKNRGYKAVFTSLKNENLIKSYEEEGFSKGTSNTTEMTLLL
ncbi:hypothetical protein [Flavobacterium psychrophilum]|uniref:N-acetyltransferase domain-containing protein n=1 Tax=Flavobacterium psychrophilum TaxID=96345 RepID=A0A7U2NEF2_FLAPS|nr:hypothetical protein [Flavobacterium psychrophilum]QRE03519.1 hypothetical protein H0H26_11605 [Flavobacterium psychrophilum]